MSSYSSRASIISNMSQTLLVDDDIDSDAENGNYDSYNSKLPSITEEGGARGYRRIRRKDSNLSAATVSAVSTDCDSDTPDFAKERDKESII